MNNNDYPYGQFDDNQTNEDMFNHLRGEMPSNTPIVSSTIQANINEDPSDQFETQKTTNLSSNQMQMNLNQGGSDFSLFSNSNLNGQKQVDFSQNAPQLFHQSDINPNQNFSLTFDTPNQQPVDNEVSLEKFPGQEEGYGSGNWKDLEQPMLADPHPTPLDNNNNQDGVVNPNELNVSIGVNDDLLGRVQNKLKIDKVTLRYTYLVASIQTLVCGLIVCISDFGYFAFQLYIYIPLFLVIIAVAYFSYTRWKDIHALSKSIPLLVVFSACEVYLIMMTPLLYYKNMDIASKVYLFVGTLHTFIIGALCTLCVPMEKFHIVAIVKGVVVLGLGTLPTVLAFSLLGGLIHLGYAALFYFFFYYEILRNNSEGRVKTDSVLIVLRGYSTPLHVFFYPFVFLYRYRAEIFTGIYWICWGIARTVAFIVCDCLCCLCNGSSESCFPKTVKVDVLPVVVPVAVVVPLR